MKDLKQLILAKVSDILESEGEKAEKSIQHALSVPNPFHGKKGSAAPNPPFERTGDLEKSVTSFVERDFSSVSLTLEVTASYAADLEYGNEKMPARPFFRPAAETMVASIRKRLSTIGD